MKKLNNFVEKIFLNVSVILLTILIAVVFMQVIARNYLHIPMLWATEVSLFCFIWTIFLGSAVAVRRKKHYIVEIFPPKFVKINIFLDILGDIAIFGLIYIMITAGYRFSIMGLSRFSTSIALPLAYFFIAIPVSGVASALFALEVLIEDIKKGIIIMKGGQVDEPFSTFDG